MCSPVSSPDTCYNVHPGTVPVLQETSLVFGFRDSLARCCYQSTQMTFVTFVEVENTFGKAKKEVILLTSCIRHL